MKICHRFIQIFFDVLYGEKKESSEYYWNLRMKLLSGNKVVRRFIRIIYNNYMRKRNAFISESAKIVGMPVFPHGVNGILISGGATIGENCVIFHQVTIGSNTLPDSKGQGAPVIGNNVYIGAGAKIIGNVKVGDNVRIGANCVVTKDVPDNTTVVSAPVCFISKEKIMNNVFIPYGEYNKNNTSC